MELLKIHDDDIANELHCMAKETTVQTKNRTFPEKDSISVNAFLQNCKAACDACGISERAAMGLFKQYRTGTSKAAVKTRVARPNPFNNGHEAGWQTYFKVFQSLLIRWAGDENIANWENAVTHEEQG